MNGRVRKVSKITYLSPKEVAARLGLSVITIYRALANGRIKAARIGKQWLIKETDLERLWD